MTRGVISFVVLALLLVLSANIVQSGFVYAVDNGKISSVRGTRNLDKLFEQVAARAPAFGGMFLDGDVLKIYLTHTGGKAAAEKAIGEVFGAERIPTGGIQVLSGQYSFRQLTAWYDRLGGLFEIDGVVLTDINERANRIRVGVEGAWAIKAVQKELQQSGIPRNAVDIAITEAIVPAVTLQSLVRPIEGGLQIHFGNFLCSLSFIGLRAGTAGFAVASHCTDRQGGVEGTQYYQPLSPNFIGTEIADPVYTKAKCQAAGIRGGKVCRYSDSAFAQKDAGVSSDQGFIARTDSVNTGSLTIVGQWRVTSEGVSLVGQTVNKVGRTTGWTQGLVTDTCVNTGVSGSRIVQLCQDFVSATVTGGDSGSPVFHITSGTDVQMRGILWGGNQAGTLFVYSPIANIERSDELGPIDSCAPTFSC